MSSARGRSPSSRELGPAPGGRGRRVGATGEAEAEAEVIRELRAEVARLLGRRHLGGDVDGAWAELGSDGSRRSAPTPGPAALLPNLLIWRCPRSACDVKVLAEHGVTHVLNCAAGDCDARDLLPPEVVVRGVRSRDADGYRILAEHLAEVEAFVDSALGSPGAVVLVHCARGQNRSAALALGYLVRRGAPLPAALAQMLELRPVVLTNSAFVEELVQLAAGLAVAARA